EIWSYSASGTMDWGPRPHPFDEVVRECAEEINYRIDLDDLRLFAAGIDAKRLYFQVSFVERTAPSTEEGLGQAHHAPDFHAEMEQLVALPFRLGPAVEWVTGRPWEPAAAAGLLTLCAKEFGIEAVREALDADFMRQSWRDRMEAEWRLRASRPGDQAVM